MALRSRARSKWARRLLSFPCCATRAEQGPYRSQIMPTRLPFTRRAGSGAGVICLHANASSSSQWRGLMDALSADHHVLAPDLLHARREIPRAGSGSCASLDSGLAACPYRQFSGARPHGSYYSCSDHQCRDREIFARVQLDPSGTGSDTQHGLNGRHGGRRL